jgi:hypothetical protein
MTHLGVKTGVKTGFLRQEANHSLPLGHSGGSKYAGIRLRILSRNKLP